jgi:hypothetical protein
MASHSLDPSFFDPPVPADIPMDFYEEEDVDQLDSDSEADDDLDASSAKKGSSKKEGKRIPGQTLLPATRLESIIQADGACKQQKDHVRPANVQCYFRRHRPLGNVERGLLPPLHCDCMCFTGQQAAFEVLELT